ncbi:DUF294 nucleotidyltransferase-like domain-containing protein [Echinimonas agarilytica]|uniref:DUF294 nucleotidyltransferase-like domain-containing protein n=1 Tax=Echinimonas agarilytica TaxID=1215918 RepID=A0AA42B6M5_9GAMM|nr:DUF294 nucleotidyltransferase-like domain-containing protein [Echinimonas agarilytica]MCM2678656.1 DUF294 nucleotidyltransferase-like domain-containing protein [Echinimonas agarilytica]
MKISEHAEHTEQLFGIRAEDIHKWIDGFFDHDGFDHYLRQGKIMNYDPYDHRRFRHCKEALEEAYQEFDGKYSRSQIKHVVETHIKDDYDGYLPSRADFENGTFTAKYHDAIHTEELSAILDAKELADYFDGISDDDLPGQSFISGFGFRIVMPTILAIVLFITAIAFVIVPLVEDSMEGQKRQMIKELTSSAVSIIESYVALEQQGELSLQQAQHRASNEIKAMRYGDHNKDYFFITDMHPRMVMHPYRTDLKGQDLTHYTDNGNTDGKQIFVEFTKLVAAEQEGYLEYLWQWKDDPDKTAEKLSYVHGIEAWQWIVGTGVYFDDVQKAIDKLERALFSIFFAIALGLAAIMGYVITQSRSIEQRKRRAEIALHEAKDRYRALVETSNEGYILEADGEILYSNNRLHRMIGYTYTELKTDTIWRQILPVGRQNARVLHHLEQLFSHTAEPGEFEAQLETKSGKKLDIILSSAKLFFSEKHGHVISFRPITRKIYGGAYGLVKQVTDYQGLASRITEEIEQSATQGHVVESLNQMPDLIREMIDAGSRPDNLRRAIGTAYDKAICRFIDLSINELGEPPVPFSFISFGSNARHDMTLFSDQDNGIVFEMPNDADSLKQVRRYFLHLAERVCGLLNQAGYSYCEGLIMATNHQWCLTVDEWKANFSDWIENATPNSILELNVFFDIRATYGKKALVTQLQQHIVEKNRQHEEFLSNYAKNCLSYKVPLSASNQIKTENLDGVASVNLKACLRPMEIFCRIYALKHDIREANTMTRLKQLAAKQEIDPNTFREMVYIFDHIWNLRFMNQIVEYTDLRKVNDILAINDLTELEQQNLRNVLIRISLFHEKIRQDFF